MNIKYILSYNGKDKKLNKIKKYIKYILHKTNKYKKLDYYEDLIQEGILAILEVKSDNPKIVIGAIKHKLLDFRCKNHLIYVPTRVLQGYNIINKIKDETGKEGDELLIHLLKYSPLDLLKLAERDKTSYESFVRRCLKINIPIIVPIEEMDKRR